MPQHCRWHRLWYGLLYVGGSERQIPKEAGPDVQVQEDHASALCTTRLYGMQPLPCDLVCNETSANCRPASYNLLRFLLPRTYKCIVTLPGNWLIMQAFHTHCEAPSRQPHCMTAMCHQPVSIWVSMPGPVPHDRYAMWPAKALQWHTFLAPC